MLFFPQLAWTEKQYEKGKFSAQCVWNLFLDTIIVSTLQISSFFMLTLTIGCSLRHYTARIISGIFMANSQV